VNFLLDANLPPRLCLWLQERDQKATHLLDLRSLRAPDKQVWELAITHQAVIITKDTDFYERSLLLGQPPQVVLVSLGNCSNNSLVQYLELSWRSVEAELSAGARLIVVHPTRLEIFA